MNIKIKYRVTVTLLLFLLSVGAVTAQPKPTAFPKITPGLTASPIPTPAPTPTMSSQDQEEHYAHPCRRRHSQPGISFSQVGSDIARPS